MTANFTQDFQVTWEKLPGNYKLPEDPVDNIDQPAIAAALSESLHLAGKIPENAITTSNYGICATIEGIMVIKAPDWVYIPQISVNRAEIRRGYTPHVQGEIPVILMELTSEKEGTEYSAKPTHPQGKWFFYQKILNVLNYIIFEPNTGILEAHRLDTKRNYYELREPDENQQYWIPEMNLYLGVWEGTRENRTGYWLRWWDEQGNLLLWGFELAEQQRQRAERLAAQLRSAGIEPQD